MGKRQSLHIGLAVAAIWIFHISGILGIAFADADWFIGKTPLNLFISLIIFGMFHKIDSIKKVVFFLLFFTVGMAAEWLGVNYGLFFGSYSYGANLGPKWGGVPLLIGSYWALLVFITATMTERITNNLILKIVLGALLMVGLDLLMEKSAPAFDFWAFEGGVPLLNYLAWFVIGALLHLTHRQVKLTPGNQLLAWNLYAAQLLFFGYFYCFPVS